MQHQRNIVNVWQQRPLGRAKNQTRGHQKKMWYKIWMLRQLSMGLSDQAWFLLQVGESWAGLLSIVFTGLIMGGLLGGSLQRRLCIISVCSGSLGEIGFLYAGWYNGRNWLATAGQDVQTGWDGDGTGVEWRDRRYQAPRERHHCILRCGGRLQAAGGGGKRWLSPITSVLQGRGVFFSEQQNNPNRMHINPD